MIDYEKDRVESVTQADTAKTLSDKVIELKNLEDEIENAEESLSKLKEKAKYISNIIGPGLIIICVFSFKRTFSLPYF